MVSWWVAYKCCNTKNKNPNLTFFSLLIKTKIAKIWKNRINRTDFPKIMDRWEERLEESYLNKYVDLRRRLMNSKDEFTLISLLICNI